MNFLTAGRRHGHGLSLAMAISVTPLAAAEASATEGIKCPYPTPSGKKSDKARPSVCGPRGPRGVKGSRGATGARGVEGLRGITGATSAPGATGAAGAAGTAGAAGVRGADGARGADGSAGLQGVAGATGAPGASGATGPTGAAGPSGATGSAGTDGATGATGADGATGATGATGAAQETSFAYIYNTDPQTVPVEGDITFDSNGALDGLSHVPSDSSLVVDESGIYKLEYVVTAAEPNQLAIFVNGADATAPTGTNTGSSQNVGQAILALSAGDVVTVRNHASAAALTLTPTNGGTLSAVNASLVAERVGDLLP